MYKSLHTDYALSLLAQAEATGTKIQLIHGAIGDGGGVPVQPSSDQSQLVRERYRATLNRVFQDPDRKNKFTAEFIIPVNVGGWVCREIGIFDSNGNLFVVGNLPETFKPNIDDGTFEDYVFRVPFYVGNAESIQVNIDPNVVTATHKWVMNTLTPAYLLPGGTTGQVLKKKSNTDGDFEWGDASTAEVFVTTVEEEQLLIADQTTVDLSTVTTPGVTIYIDGIRLTNKTGTDGWQVQSATQIKLGKSYPDKKILAVQNETLGNAPYPLAQQNNLSDVLDKPLARQNLSVMSVDEAKFNDCPPGTIITLASKNIPIGYRLLKCNGAAVSRTVYAELFSIIGATYGAGDGVTTFNVPDARGEFPRYADDGRGIDTGRIVGSKQQATSVLMGDPTLSYGALVTLRNTRDDNSDTIRTALNGEVSTANGTNLQVLSSQSAQVDPSTVQAVTMSVRPRNIALLACIRY